MINSLLIQQDVLKALEEDIGTGDVTAGLLPSKQEVQAKIISREPMLMCGQPWADGVFQEVDKTLNIHWQVSEGQWLDNPTDLCYLSGNARSILTAERTVLNFLQTLSATATQTYQYVDCLKNSKTKVLDTRKTIPGLRYAQKYAVACAGGKNHRLGLFDAYLIKENHIKACGSIRNAILAARQNNERLFVEVEVETLEELQLALEAGPDRVLLDNFSFEMLYSAVEMANPYSCDLEASGGIELATLQKVAETGVDFVSVGSITKSIKAIDLSLLIVDSEHSSQ